jgi:hypothetical protein
VPVTADIGDIEGPIPTGPNNVIYGAANVEGAGMSVALTPFGYIEEEYFISGTADAFQHTDAGLEPIKTGLAYTTRILVRRPSNPKQFSGVVHFEPFHPTGGVTFTWPTTHQYIMSRGDIYIAAGLGDADAGWSGSPKYPNQKAPVGQHKVTKWFDPVRYDKLKWPEEEGIRFDVMADIGRKLRSNDGDNPLRGLNVRAVIVSGWSYTGSLQRVFINEGFHTRARLENGQAAFDGYLIGVSSRWNAPGYLPLYNDEPFVPADDPRRSLKQIDAKVIEFLTESEVELDTGPQAPDSDEKIGSHRLYELGGVIHVASVVDPTMSFNELPNLVQLIQRGYPQRQIPNDPVFSCPLPQSDVPMGALVRATVDNLRHWILDGRKPPRAKPMVWKGDKIARDEVGNVEGGIRPAEFEVPIARYGRYQGKDLPNCSAENTYPNVFFLRNEFSKEDLIHRYKSAENYLKRYDREIDRLLKQRWLLPEDGLRLKAKAIENASRLFR